MFAFIGILLPWLFLWPYSVPIPGTWGQSFSAEIREWRSMWVVPEIFTVRGVGRTRVFMRNDPSFYEANIKSIQGWPVPQEAIDSLVYARTLNLDLFERQAHEQILQFAPLVSGLYLTPTNWIALTRRCRSIQIDEVGWPIRCVCIVRTAGPTIADQDILDKTEPATRQGQAISVPNVAPLPRTLWSLLAHSYSKFQVSSGLRDGGTVITWRLAWEALIVNILFWLICGAVLSWLFREIVRSVAWRFFAQRRLKQGRCARCGYPAPEKTKPTGRADNEQSKCSECGLPVGALPGGLLGTRPIMVHR